MSSSYSEVVEFVADHYPKDCTGPHAGKFKARLHYHHTSDTVAFQLWGPDDKDFVDRFCLCNDKFDALAKLIRKET
jgi:hypothetical protein